VNAKLHHKEARWILENAGVLQNVTMFAAPTMVRHLVARAKARGFAQSYMAAGRCMWRAGIIQGGARG
jgi:hypothetical protein